MSKPLAVLTRLEDSPPALDRGLVAAYLRSIYKVLDPEFLVQIGELSTELDKWLANHNFQTFAFLTAANPRSLVLPEKENRERNELLLEMLLPLISEGPYAAVHLDENDVWPEEQSWWVPGLSAEKAVDLGRAFDQNAIVFWQQGRAVELWWL